MAVKYQTKTYTSTINWVKVDKFGVQGSGIAQRQQIQNAEKMCKIDLTIKS